jgi:hypothetical protein
MRIYFKHFPARSQRWSLSFIKEDDSSVARYHCGANQNSKDGRYRFCLARRVSTEALASELRNNLSTGVPRILCDLFYPNVDVVIDRDGCSHGGSIGFDARESNPVGMSSCSSVGRINRARPRRRTPDFAPSSETPDFASSFRLREATSGKPGGYFEQAVFEDFGLGTLPFTEEALLTTNRIPHAGYVNVLCFDNSSRGRFIRRIWTSGSSSLPLLRRMLWLLFVLTQVLEFLQLRGGQNGSQVI